ncbi:unnamed protein product [Fusarium venenatum]|uniref:Uncharacterized protein n=1 Tax=Fusarium venenatum TaxID=56646 RepID=A0A2L2T687_9HYPO|nr:uncharacterized protein FVRRES_12149 [Fusarium venenatum]CEI39458.1 unnamed protein product [Fusarium venenatum]
MIQSSFLFDDPGLSGLNDPLTLITLFGARPYPLTPSTMPSRSRVTGTDNTALSIFNVLLKTSDIQLLWHASELLLLLIDTKVHRLEKKRDMASRRCQRTASSQVATQRLDNGTKSCALASRLDSRQSEVLRAALSSCPRYGKGEVDSHYIFSDSLKRSQSSGCIVSHSYVPPFVTRHMKSTCTSKVSMCQLHRQYSRADRQCDPFDSSSQKSHLRSGYQGCKATEESHQMTWCFDPTIHDR